MIMISFTRDGVGNEINECIVRHRKYDYWCVINVSRTF